MTERTPKSKCTRKIEQDRSISKILTFGQHLHKSQLFWKLDVCTIFELRMKKRVPKSECTRKIEWDRSVLKILTFWSRSKVRLVKAFSLSFFFFFFEAVRTGSDFRVGPGRIWTNKSAVDDVIHDVTVLRVRVARVARAARVARMARASTSCPNRHVGLKAAPPNLLAAREGACLVPWAWNSWVLLIKGCRTPWYSQFSKIMGRFAQIWRIRLRIVASLWRCVEARAWGFGPEISGFCRSKSI